MPELVGNTGQADQTSVWGSGLLQTATSWGSAAAGLYNQFRGNGNTSHAGAPSPPATTTTVQEQGFLQKYGLILAAVGAVLLLLFVLRKH